MLMGYELATRLLPFPCFTDHENKKLIIFEVPLVNFFAQLFGRLFERFIPALKRSPVNSKHLLRSQVNARLNGVGRVHLHRLHYFPRFISADRKQSKIERPEPFSGLGKAAEVAAVSPIIEPPSVSDHDP